jgi:hypothetical protein
MHGQEGFSKIKALLFDGTKYSFCIIRMGTYLMDLVFDIWKSIVTSYIAPTTPPIDVASKKPSKNNAKSMNTIFCNLFESNFFKVMHCESKK